MKDGDTVIFYNYRGDRPRELIQAFVLDEFLGKVKASPDSGLKGFERGAKLKLNFVTMAEYWDALNPYVKVAFPRPPKFVNIAGETVSKLGLRQFPSATEKYPHVTFFFNDYREEPFPGESPETRNRPRWRRTTSSRRWRRRRCVTRCCGVWRSMTAKSSSW